MRIKEFTLTAVTASAAAVVGTFQPSAGVALTLLVTTLSPPRELEIVSLADVSGTVFSIVGRDRYGNTMTELLTGPNATTVRTKGVYAAVVSITPTASVAQNTTVGYGSRVPGPWIQSNTTQNQDAVETPSVYVSADGAASEFSIETTGEHLAYPSNAIYGGTRKQGDITTSAVVAVAVNPISAGTTEKAPAFEQAAYYRVVKTNTGTGNLTVRIARPSF